LNEVFGQKPVHIEGDNPFLCNVTNFGYIDTKKDGKSDAERPSVGDQRGIPTGRDCRFSHNHKLFRRSGTNMNTQPRQAETSSSSQHPSFPQDSQRGAPLRSQYHRGGSDVFIWYKS
jgi:hypothetical protein